MNVAFLMTWIPRYFAVCIESLAHLDDTNVFMICRDPSQAAPYDAREVTPAETEVHSFRSLPTGPTIVAMLQEFKPEVVVVSGWQIPAFRFALRKLPVGTVRVLQMDNQWLGTAKQRAGVLVAPWYLHRLYDIAFLPGRNQEVFANKLGFRNNQIWRGLYSCDYPHFADPSRTHSRHRGFLYVGRLVKEKGISTLADAYDAYRRQSDNPWGLDVYGTGPEGARLQQIAGVTMNGFAQPRDLGQIYRRSECFILPSLFEPWGTVIHEATASGLPVICSTACGAAPHLVEDGVNGYLVEPGNVSELAAAMYRYASLEAVKQQQMSEMSTRLASRYTPMQWATVFRQRAEEAVIRLAERGPKD